MPLNIEITKFPKTAIAIKGEESPSLQPPAAFSANPSSPETNAFCLNPDTPD
jgi:hypothetical protein